MLYLISLYVLVLFSIVSIYLFSCNFIFDLLVFQDSVKYLTSCIHKFSSFPSVMISSFIPLWSEKIFDKISVFVNLLKLVLWPNI